MSFLSLLIPNFHLQAALRDQALRAPIGSANESVYQGPAVLINEHEKKPVIRQLNQAAESAGIAAGMTPSQALARCLDLLVLTHSMPQEFSVQEILLEQAFTLSPYVEATAPGLCTIQFFDQRDRTAAISGLLNELQSCQIFARAGGGPTPDISYLAACRAEPLLVVADSNEFLKPLPLEVLLRELPEVRLA